MALRTIPVAAEMLSLVAAGQPEAVMVWEDQGGRRVLTDRQEHDPDTSEPLWTAYLMSTSADRPEVMQVRVSAAHQPVLTVFGPVALDNLEVNCRVDKNGRLAQYWTAAGVRDVAHTNKREPQPA